MNSSRSVQDPCPACGRPIARGPSADRHHWLPRSRGGRDSDAIHVVCHRKIHSVFTPKELASDYGTPEAVRAHPEIAAFVRWVRRKPPDFIDSHAKPRRLVPAGWDLCQSYFMLQQYQKIVDSAPKIIDIIETADRKTDFFGRSYCPYPWLCGLYGLSLGHTGDFETGKIFCEKALETARSLDDWFILTLVHSCYGSFYVAQSNGVLAIVHCMNTLRCTEKTNDLIFRSASHSTMALGYYYLNDLDSALKSVYEGRRIAEDLGIEFRLSYGYFAESLICFAQNNMEKALNAAQTALRLACKNNDRCMKHSLCSA